MSFFLSGEACIPGEEFWEWVFQELPVNVADTDPLPLSFVISADNRDVAWVVGTGEDGAPVRLHSIDMALFWDFVGRYVPELIQFYQFGVPAVDDNQDIVLCFACSTETLRGQPGGDTPYKQWDALQATTSRCVVLGQALNNPDQYFSE